MAGKTYGSQTYIWPNVNGPDLFRPFFRDQFNTYWLELQSRRSMEMTGHLFNKLTPPLTSSSPFVRLLKCAPLPFSTASKYRNGHRVNAKNLGGQPPDPCSPTGTKFDMPRIRYCTISFRKCPNPILPPKLI